MEPAAEPAVPPAKAELPAKTEAPTLAPAVAAVGEAAVSEEHDDVLHELPVNSRSLPMHVAVTVPETAPTPEAGLSSGWRPSQLEITRQSSMEPNAALNSSRRGSVMPAARRGSVALSTTPGATPMSRAESQANRQANEPDPLFPASDAPASEQQAYYERELQQLFGCYCNLGESSLQIFLDHNAFHKLCRECKLADPKLTANDLYLLYLDAIAASTRAAEAAAAAALAAAEDAARNRDPIDDIIFFAASRATDAGRGSTSPQPPGGANSPVTPRGFGRGSSFSRPIAGAPPAATVGSASGIPPVGSTSTLSAMSSFGRRGAAAAAAAVVAAGGGGGVTPSLPAGPSLAGRAAAVAASAAVARYGPKLFHRSYVPEMGVHEPARWLPAGGNASHMTVVAPIPPPDKERSAAAGLSAPPPPGGVGGSFVRRNSGSVAHLGGGRLQPSASFRSTAGDDRFDGASDARGRERGKARQGLGADGFRGLMARVAIAKFPAEPGGPMASLRVLVSKHVGPTVRAIRARAGLAVVDSLALDAETQDWMRRYEPQLGRVFKVYCSLDNALGYVPGFADQGWEQVQEAGSTMSYAELRKLCMDKHVVPKLVTMRDLESCFRKANFGTESDGNAHDLSYPEFVECMGLIAVSAGNKNPELAHRPAAQKFLHLMGHLKFVRPEMEVDAAALAEAKRHVGTRMLSEAEYRVYEALVDLLGPAEALAATTNGFKLPPPPPPPAARGAAAAAALGFSAPAASSFWSGGAGERSSGLMREIVHPPHGWPQAAIELVTAAGAAHNAGAHRRALALYSSAWTRLMRAAAITGGARPRHKGDGGDDNSDMKGVSAAAPLGLSPVTAVGATAGGWSSPDPSPSSSSSALAPLVLSSPSASPRIPQGGHPTLDAESELFLAAAVGSVLESSARDAEAILEYRKAVGAATRLRAGHPDHAVGHACLGAALYHLKDYERSFWALLKALTVREDAPGVGRFHVDTAALYNNVGAALDRLGRPLAALRLFERAAAILVPALGADHPRCAIAVRNAALTGRRPLRLSLPAFCAPPLSGKAHKPSRPYLAVGYFETDTRVVAAQYEYVAGTALEPNYLVGMLRKPT